jgi:hypothetical protein
MNKELIHQLVSLSGLYVDDDNKVWGDPAHDITHQVHELVKHIILECARADSEANNCDHVEGESYNWGILNHFGVKP